MSCAPTIWIKDWDFTSEREHLCPPLCEATSPWTLWSCNRPQGHTGRHLNTGYPDSGRVRVKAVWA